ncbi:YitT family protein [Mycoplasmopsis canis]|uniref:YitT family protein n=1 Tax=Mycoplasmopsis canis TaxID=29555 RepID=UPI00025AF021|nr:YitT family protein [Mycoplasmopsis canis]EIE40142.1 ABC transporter, permease protein [Mycoplasmopsis canis UF33]
MKSHKNLKNTIKDACCKALKIKKNDVSKNDEVVDPEIHLNSIDIEVHKLKYKMGQYLYNSKSEKISFKLFFKRYWFKVIILFLAATIFNAGIQIFLKSAETIPSGVTGIPTLIQYAVPSTEPYFALIYLGCNVPLFLIFGRHIKRSFVFLTIIFMIFQIVTNFFFTQEKIVHWFHQNIKLTQRYESYTDWSSLIYTAIGASLIGVGIAMSWKVGGSTGGTDIIGYYFSTRSKKSVGQVLSVIGFATAIIFLIIFAFVKPNYLKDEPLSVDAVLKLSKNEYAELHDYKGIQQTYEEVSKRYEILFQNYKESRIYFGMREVSTFFYIIVVNLVINLLYPKYKKVSMTIVSTNPQKVLAYFKLINYWHSYRIESFQSGYTGQENFKITTVMLSLETNHIIQDLKMIDPKIWISVQNVSRIVGSFTTDFVE